MSASTRFDIKSLAVSQATAQAGVGINITSGSVTITGAVVGATSGAMAFGSGATDCTNAGGTGGPSGGVTISTGACTSTLGVSGSSSDIDIQTGNSDDANSGNLNLRTGTAAGTRGAVKLFAPGFNFSNQSTQFLMIDNTVNALQIGASGALQMLTFTSTNNVEAITANAIFGTTGGVAGGLVRIVQGSTLRTVAESGTVTSPEAVFAGGFQVLQTNTFLVGTRVAFTALVRVSTVSGTPTAQVRIRIGAAGTGGTLTYDTTARTVADEDMISLTGYLDCRSTGVGGTLTGSMQYFISAPDALASSAGAEWGQDLAGSTPGTWTVACDTTTACNVTITGQTDGAGTALNLESFRIYLDA